MNDVRFDTWTRRRVGRAAGGLLALLVLSGSSDNAAGNMHSGSGKHRHQRKRKRKRSRRCCQEIRRLCTADDECCRDLRCERVSGFAENRCCAGEGAFCQEDDDCCANDFSFCNLSSSQCQRAS